MLEVLVSESDFDIAEQYQKLCNGLSNIGAVVTFVGLVRDLNEDGKVSSLELQHYPGMTESLIKDILQEAQQRWNLERAIVIHRVGPLKPSDQIVYIGVASAHRKEAFAAAEFIMDYLKTKATFWKKESRKDSSGKDKARWLDMKDSDKAASDRWKSEP